jgi:hypothetical protein
VSTDRLKVIGIAVAVLLVLWGATELLPSGTDRLRADFRLPAAAAEDVDTAVVMAPGETVVVARVAGGGRWTVNGFAASSTAVAELFQALRDTVGPELVARSAGSFARLGVDTASARRLRVAGGAGTLAELFVSERGPDFGSAYVRAPGDSAVYAWRGELASVVRRRVDDWRDKVIAAVTPDSVGQVEIERGTRRYVLQRQGAAWTLAGGRPADSAAVARLLGEYRTLAAIGFPTAAQMDSAFRGGGRRERRATLRSAGGAALLVLEFDSTSTGFWVRRPPDGTVFRLDAWRADQLTPADSTLRRR